MLYPKREETATTSTPPIEEREKKTDHEEAASLVLAGGAEEGKEVAGAVPNAMALPRRAFSEKPPPKELKESLEPLFAG